MGTVLNAHCECGYSAKASCASSRREHGRVFNYPHQCDQSHQVVTVDLLLSPPSCPECGSQVVARYSVAIRHPKYGLFYRLMARINGSAQKQRQATAALNARFPGPTRSRVLRRARYRA